MKPYYEAPDTRFYLGDVREVLRQLPAASVQCVVTSPPYWSLRDYGVAGQIGLEETPGEYVATMVDVFREVRRVLRDDGTLWLNLGDTYSAGGRGTSAHHLERMGAGTASAQALGTKKPTEGLKPKDLVGIPWMVAFALRADAWYLRTDIIWDKPNAMPESVTDRPTRAHEYIFLLSKSERYFYDADAVKEPQSHNTHARFGKDGMRTGNGRKQAESPNGFIRDKAAYNAAILPNGRNKRSVWTVPSFAFPESHFATFPPDLIKPCILAGCPAGETVLDPFGGAGTTSLVCRQLGRKSVYIDLKEDYVTMAIRRLEGQALPLPLMMG